MTKTESRKISVIVISHNGPEKLIEHNVRSLFQQSMKDFDLYYVVSGSNGSIQKALSTLSQFKDHRLKTLVYRKNIGPIMTWNKVIEEVKTKYIVLLNVSTVVPPDFLEKMVSGAERISAKFGGATPQILQYEPPHKAYNLATNPRNPGIEIINMILLPFKKSIGKHSVTEGKVCEMKSFWGSCCILATEMVKKLKFDNLLFIKGEEMDLSMRAEKQGYRFYYFPFTWAKYKIGIVTRKGEYPSPRIEYANIRNNIYIPLKNSDAAQLPLWIIRIILFIVAHMIAYPKMIRHILAGAISAMRLLPLIRFVRSLGPDYYRRFNFSWELDSYLKSLVT